MKLERFLLKKFGFERFREGQKEIIEDILQGHDVLAMLPTGTGKSLCYQFPALFKEGSAVIISPLLSLMEDQVQQLKSSGEKRVVALNSFLSFAEKKKILTQLDEFKLIYVSPEILQSSHVQKVLKQINISLFVVDEAHCISQWGHEFRTDYLKLETIREMLGNPPCLAITATATIEVQQDIIKYLNMSKVREHIHSIDRPNIALIVQHMESVDDKMNKLIELTNYLEGPGMIYFSSRRWAEYVAHHLRSVTDYRIAYYHGGLDSEARILIQQQFIQDQLDVICCTNAFGMGINKPNIRYVIHFHYPSQLESYLQEIGRAGRDGENSVAILLFSNDDEPLPQLLINQEFPDEEQIDHLFRSLLQIEKTGGSFTKEVEERVMLEVGLGDTVWRFLQFQLEKLGGVNHSQITLSSNANQIRENILRTIKQRKLKKRLKLEQMEIWIRKTTGCRRENYLSVFNESLVQRPKNCCDLCDVQLELYSGKGKHRNEKGKIDWKEELRLFLPHDS
ncbi:RecQ family ATP-dependent DNA helicase [Anaerobacillus sp. MEB173]|uniref:RecQ family ATP-dependent DNA helicase n=1 Tax=Anaerobacillus sp. MEB173 TaxID=3383345 RepID=UPI003F8EB1CD